MSELKNDSERIELRYCRACETEVDSVDGECTKCGQPTERRKQMSEANNFIYLVMQHDISMGKEWVMYAYDNYTDAEDTVKHHNKENGSDYPRYFVKSVRYFKKGGV